MSTIRKIRLAGALFSLLAILAMASVAGAQSSSINGTVTDPTGAVVPQVRIVANMLDTNTERVTETTESGVYALPNLVPGVYTVMFRKGGFRTLQFASVTLTVGQALTLDAKLEVSGISETVTVEGNQVAPINTTDAQISNVVEEQQIKSLPLITRDPYQLVLLSPGEIQSNTRLGGFSTNGQREQNNNFLLDGVDNNDTAVPGAASGLNALNPDSTQEFRVITNNFGAEYGRDNGAVIDIKTTSGTNTLHGDAYWFGRYNALGARDFFNPIGTPMSPYVRNDFGASVGGPIIHDKTFWFANYEGQRFNTAITQAINSPTQAFRSGVFTYNGTPIDVSTPASANNGLGFALDPTVQKILALYPIPTAPGPNDAIGTAFYPSASRTVNDDFTIRVDHQLTKTNTLFARYSFNRDTDPDAFHDDILPGGIGATATYARTQNAVIGLTSTFGSTLVNEFRFGGNRTNLQFTCTGTGVFNGFGFVDGFGRGADFAIPGLSSTFGCGALGDSNGQSRFTGTYHTIDNMTKTYGSHTFKWGGEFRAVYENGFDDFGTRTLFAFNTDSGFGIPSLTNVPNSLLNNSTLEDMVSGLLGFTLSETQTQFFDRSQNPTASDNRNFRQREFGLFFQDNWKIKSNLTLTYGLRWEYFGVPFEAHGNFSTLFVDPSSTATSFTYTTIGGPSGGQLYPSYWKGFDPRIGIAWDPFKDGKTSVRAGWGIFRDRLYGNIFTDTKDNPPFAQSFSGLVIDSLQNTSTPPPLTTSATITNFDPNTFTGGLFFLDQISTKFKTPYSENWNFGIQHEFGKNLQVEVNYVGVNGFRESRELDGNPNQPALISQLEAFCVPGNPLNTGFGDPANAQFGTADGQCSQATLQFGALRLGGFPFVLTGAGNGQLVPFNAANNTAFLDPSSLGFGGALIASVAKSRYNGLQVNVTKRYSSGFQIQGAYTWSHSLDNASDSLSPAAGNRTLPRNSFNLAAEYGNSDFDVRHRLVTNFVYDPNIGRGKGHLSDGVMGRLLEGWEVAGIATFQTGLPYDVFGNIDTQHTGLSDRATLVDRSVLHVAPANPSPTTQVFTGVNVAAFNPDDATIMPIPFGAPSNVHRNSFFGPGTNNWDSVLAKNTSITERFKLEFRAEFYNIFNRPEFTQPGNSVVSSLFGYSTSEATRADGTTAARQIQFALKLKF